ncbi:MAG: haloalkane dehalogenase [Sulfurifustaceae bacterium]
MSVLRTPDERFAALPGYAFTPHYLETPALRGLRIHYLDEGAGALTFLCLHGQPTWSYLYRRMVPAITRAGFRVVAPDMIGFGRSDKPQDEAFYTFSMHRRMLLDLIEALDLSDIVLVCQDWGGLLGLTIPMEMPERFRGLLVMNTDFAGGDTPLSQGFIEWRAWSNAHPDMAIARLMQRGCPHLSAAEAAAYEAPFPDARYKSGVRRFPNLVPDRPDADGAAVSRAARDWWRNEWRGRSFMVIGVKDPVLGPPVMAGVRSNIRACPPPLELSEAGHFVQEWSDAFMPEALRALPAG